MSKKRKSAGKAKIHRTSLAYITVLRSQMSKKRKSAGKAINQARREASLNRQTKYVWCGKFKKSISKLKRILQNKPTGKTNPFY